MTNIARSLLLDGLIEEAGSSGNTGGKPRTLLRIRGDHGYALGVSVDLHHVRLAILDFAGRVLGTMTPDGPFRTVDELASTLSSATAEITARHSIDRDDLLGVGVAGPGPQDRSVYERPPGPYADQWLDDSVPTVIGNTLNLPVLMLNDANAVAMGEYGLSLDTRSSGNFACIYMGESGVGSGIFLDGQLVLGSNSFAGAVAHVSMDVSGPVCFCGSRGCLELYGSPRAVIEAVRRYDQEQHDPLIGVSESGPLAPSDMELVYAAARSGHPFAVEHVLTVADYIASAAATMATILDLDLIILAGDTFAGMEEVYLESMQKMADRIRQAGVRSPFAVRPTGLASGNYAPAVGAGLAVLELPHLAEAGKDEVSVARP
ncbi:ROK family protein [Microbacterium sp. bgisy189]|uniref:ROK family protein n=1 Tax=Microbacterium sp. bgisy189 TaxID=3413798 RepID=UPI003EBA37C0